MSRTKTDLELITEFKAGNQASFEELIQRYSVKAYGLATRLTRNQEDAEEVLQDVFTTVYRKIDGFQGKSSFSSWLYRVTVNAAFMKLRKRRQNQSVSMEDVMPQVKSAIVAKSKEMHEADDRAARTELLHLIEEAILKLPDDYRPVYVLRDIDGLTSKEVGRILNISIPAVKSRLHRSRLMLRRRLQHLYDEYRAGSGTNTQKSAGNL